MDWRTVMNISKLALAGAIAGLLSAGTAYAQFPTGPVSVEQTAYEYNSYYSQNDDQAAGAKERGVEGEPDPAAAAAAPEGPPSAGNGCGTLLNPYCCLGEQWKLFDGPCLKCNNINIAGWIAQSYTWNTTNPSDRFNGPVTWTDRSNEYQLNQLYIYAEKTTDTKGCGTDFGWRTDMMFGTDYRFNTESGLETRAEFQQPILFQNQRFYGIAFTQFYGEVAVDDLKVKVGHWYAPVGYEVVPTTGNFFPSLPYTFQYGEPFTMTGIHSHVPGERRRVDWWRGQSRLGQLRQHQPAHGWHDDLHREVQGRRLVCLCQHVRTRAEPNGQFLASATCRRPSIAARSSRSTTT